MTVAEKKFRRYLKWAGNYFVARYDGKTKMSNHINKYGA
jgi:hypothetical protein